MWEFFGTLAAAAIAGVVSLVASKKNNKSNKQDVESTNQTQLQIANDNVNYQKEFAQNQYQWQSQDMTKAGLNPLGANFGSMSFNNVQPNLQSAQSETPDISSASSLVSSAVSALSEHNRLKFERESENKQYGLQSAMFAQQKAIEDQGAELERKRFEEEQRLNHINEQNKRQELRYAALDRLREMASTGVSYDDACSITGLKVDKDTYDNFRKATNSEGNITIRKDNYENSVGVPIEGQGSTTKDVVSGARVIKEVVSPKSPKVNPSSSSMTSTERQVYNFKYNGWDVESSYQSAKDRGWFSGSLEDFEKIWDSV